MLCCVEVASAVTLVKLHLEVGFYELVSRIVFCRSLSPYIRIFFVSVFSPPLVFANLIEKNQLFLAKKQKVKHS